MRVPASIRHGVRKLASGVLWDRGLSRDEGFLYGEPVNRSYDLGSSRARVARAINRVLRAIGIVNRTIGARRNAELFENRSCPFGHESLPAVESVRMIPLRLALVNKSLTKNKTKS